MSYLRSEKRLRPFKSPAFNRSAALHEYLRLGRQQNPNPNQKQRAATGKRFSRLVRSPKLQGSKDLDRYIIFKHAYRSAAPFQRSLSPGPDGLLAKPRIKLEPNMHSYAQFLTTPTADTPGTTLFLHLNDKRYIIGNCAEGTQRACTQRRFGMAKIEDLFISGKVDWANYGGTLGMILTLADVNASRAAQRAEDIRQGNEPLGDGPVLRLHGGRNLTHLLATARRFIFRRGMPLSVHEIREKEFNETEWQPVWNDDNMKVWSMAILPIPEPSPTPRWDARKRKSDEISHDFERPVDVNDIAVLETDAEKKDRYDQMTEAVVRKMFGSSWSLDALTEMPLSSVVMPAAIFVRDDKGVIQKYEGPKPGSGVTLPDIKVLCRSPWPASKLTNLPPTKPSHAALSYIVRGHDHRGKFDVKKATALGVTPGPDYRKLTEGKSVLAKDGTTVTPDMVLSPDRPGGGLAIIEIPSNDYIKPTLDREEWGVKDVMGGIGAIVWILGSGVKVADDLQKFMVEHSEWEHIVSSPDYCSNYLSLDSAAASAIRLHQIAPDNFPIPVHSNASTVKWTAEGSNLPRPFHQARIGQRIGTYPNVSISSESIQQYLDTAEVVNEASPELLELAESARKEVSDPEFLAKLEEQQKDIPSKDAEVIALGTGSALPSKYRNVSATLVRVPGYGNYLFDCGENTLGQLRRVFGAELPSVLQNLKMIWISHLHADHHLGTASVIREWHRVTENSEAHEGARLLVSSDIDMLNWLREYADVEDYGYSRLETRFVEDDCPIEFDPEQEKDWGLKSIVACRVSHCHGAYAVAVSFPNGFKVAYSGDCRPSDNFVRIGKGATLLIHEATFDDELQSDAVAKKHSTTSEALDVGRRMGARRILLTHFSQRYQKIPVMSEEGGSEDVKAGVCFDYMKVKVGDIAKLEAFRPALLKLFEEKEPEEKDELEESAESKQPKTKASKKAAKKAAAKKDPQSKEPLTDRRVVQTSD